MSNLADFLAMGGHGPYVWSAWTLAVLALGANAFAAKREKRRALAEARSHSHPTHSHPPDSHPTHPSDSSPPSIQ